MYIPELFRTMHEVFREKKLICLKILDRQHCLHNFFQTAKYLFQNSSRQGNPLCQNFVSQINPYARIFPDNDTHMSYLVWMKKDFPDYKNFPCSNATTLQEVLGLWLNNHQNDIFGT